jgi:hypothetical protein
MTAMRGCIVRICVPLFVIVIQVAIAGCTGTLEGGPAGPPPASSTTPSSCAKATTAASTLRRLTRVEFDYAVEDLFGDTSRPAQSFAPDDITTGFEVGGIVSPLLAEQYLSAATSIAERVTMDVSALTGCGADEACARDFIEDRARRAYRRELTGAEIDSLLELYRQGRLLEGHRTGIQLVVEAMLVSPNFLYQVEAASPDLVGGETVRLNDHELASRLSFFLWRSIPDRELLDAAEAGELTDPVSLELQARRMLEDERALRVIGDFHRQWLDLSRLDGVERDPAIYPEYSPALATDMRASLDMYVRDVMSNGGTLDELLRGGFAFVNERLAPIYGLEDVAGAEFRRISIDEGERAGLLAHPALLTQFGKADQSDPIHRGIFVRTRLLCQHLPPPPADFDITPPAIAPGLTTRERFRAHSSNEACAGCHALIDPIGFGFENYDAIGRYRATEEGRPIDASGEVISGGDATGTFDGLIELSDRLAQSDTVRECVARQWFRFASARVETSDDSCSLDALDERFASGGFELRELIIGLVTTDAFMHRRIPAASGTTSL